MGLLLTLSFVVLGLFAVTQPVCGQTSTVTVTSSAHLEDLLCDTAGLTNDSVIFELISSETYTITPGNFCITYNASDVTIMGNDSQSPAVIRCLSNENDDILTRGFAFVNTDRLSLANVIIENCGTIMTEDVLEQGNSSLIYFGQGEAAVLVCNSFCNLTLSNVHIKNYTGHAIVGIDMYGKPVLDSVVISDNFAVHQSCRHGFNTCKGSGIVWTYTNNTNDNVCTADGNTLVAVSDATFSDNTGFTNDGNRNPARCSDRVADSFYSRNPLFTPVDLPSTGAITLIYQQYSPVKVKVTDSNFTGNAGHCFGAILAVYLSEARYSSLQISGCTFSDNRQIVSQRRSRYFGASLSLFMKYQGRYSENRDCIRIDNCRFLTGRAISTSSQIALTQFPSNVGFCLASLQDITGGNTNSLYALSLDAGDSLEVELSNISLIGRRDSVSTGILGVEEGLFTFSFVSTVSIDNSRFQNLSGPVIYAESTDIVLAGNVLFGNTNALGSLTSNGAAMFLRGESILWLKEPLNLTLYNNTALQGGAIYSVSRYTDYCAIQFIAEYTYNENTIEDMDVNVTFTSNRANVAGNSMYVAPFTSCSLRLSTTIDVNSTIAYDAVFHVEHPVDNGLLEISSAPMQICMCGDDPLNTNRSALSCTGDPIPTVYTHPGRTLYLSMVPVDESFNRVFSFIVSSPQRDVMSTGRDASTLDWQLGYGQDVVRAPGYNCTAHAFNLFSRTAERATNGVISVYPSGSVYRLFIPVVLSYCPPGLHLLMDVGSCGCPSFQLRGASINISCNISTGLLTRPGTSWIGIAIYKKDNLTNSTVLTARDVEIGYSDNCPERYCNQSESIINVSNSNICLHGRTGVLCGRCKEGLSVTIGTPTCHKCSKWHLFFLPLFALLGVAIVALLMILQLTVSQGTINGLIFYSNLLSLGAYYLFTYDGADWAIIFISLLNLEFGFPVCLYDGLDDITKGILSIVFPVYRWIISGVLVFASSRSYKLSKLVSTAVPVLATLIYITYYELLRFSIDGLTFATISIQSQTDDTMVWFYDGNVKYLQDFRHIILFCLSLLVAFLFVIPYGVLLTGISFFNRFRIINKFKPFVDAYCAPYKDRYRFWFGLRLWVLTVIYVLFVILRNNPSLIYLCQAIVLILFVVAQVAVMPFKNVIINWLDLFFMVNALLLTVVAIHNSFIGIQIVSSISVAATFVVFCCIVGYHGWNFWKRVKVVYEEWKANRCYKTEDNAEPNDNVVTQTSVAFPTSRGNTQYQKFNNMSKFRDSILNESAARETTVI